MRPAKIQISLRICAVCLVASLEIFLIAKDAMILYEGKDDTDKPTVTDVQADFSLRGAHMSKGTFSDGEVHNVYYVRKGILHHMFKKGRRSAC